MNVVDSSAWLEYFADGPNAASLARPIVATAELIVPSLTVYKVVDLDVRLALNAARLSLETKLPMPDSGVRYRPRKP